MTAASQTNRSGDAQPLRSLDEWENFLKERYPAPAPATPFCATDPDKKPEQFRNYEAEARPSVREFYRLNHRGQTHEFVTRHDSEFARHER
jgi:inositol oxygenase